MSPLRIAVLVKQVPRFEEMRLEAGRLMREGVELEVNPYCRRANAKAVELAGAGGEVVVFTMGPPSAEDALREMIACGADRGVHLCDPALAGSDTLATARALAAALRREGPFDLVLAGLNSVDADTGQVGPEVAELLGLPFASGVRDLSIGEGGFEARLETDDGYRMVAGPRPAVLTTAERLTDPSKADPPLRAAVPSGKITRLGLTDLGLEAGEVGAEGSPTAVGPVRLEEVARRRLVATGPEDAVEHLVRLGAFEGPFHQGGAVDETGGDGPSVWCFAVPGHELGRRQLLGEAARLARQLGGSVTAFVVGDIPESIGAEGADRVARLPADTEPEQWAGALGAAVVEGEPAVLLVLGTRDGREVAARVAAHLGLGLTGDAIAFDLEGHRLIAWKPAFGGRLVAPITSRSAVQMATVRPGVLASRIARPARAVEVVELTHSQPAQVHTRAVERLDLIGDDLAAAPSVVAVGVGLDPGEYRLLDPLRDALGDAPLAATRKVTDRGWLPRSRQVGITGHSIAPRLLVSVGASGRFNHAIGFRRAQVVLAINADPEALIFEHADVGLLGDWHELVPRLVTALLTHPQLRQD